MNTRNSGKTLRSRRYVWNSMEDSLGSRQHDGLGTRLHGGQIHTGGVSFPNLSRKTQSVKKVDLGYEGIKSDRAHPCTGTLHNV